MWLELKNKVTRLNRYQTGYAYLFCHPLGLIVFDTSIKSHLPGKWNNLGGRLHHALPVWQVTGRLHPRAPLIGWDVWSERPRDGLELFAGTVLVEWALQRCGGTVGLARGMLPSACLAHIYEALLSGFVGPRNHGVALKKVRDISKIWTSSCGNRILSCITNGAPICALMQYTRAATCPDISLCLKWAIT